LRVSFVLNKYEQHVLADDISLKKHRISKNQPLDY